jgi:hypothetical protein
MNTKINNTQTNKVSKIAKSVGFAAVSLVLAFVGLIVSPSGFSYSAEINNLSKKHKAGVNVSEACSYHTESTLCIYAKESDNSQYYQDNLAKVGGPSHEGTWAMTVTKGGPTHYGPNQYVTPGYDYVYDFYTGWYYTAGVIGRFKHVDSEKDYMTTPELCVSKCAIF